MTRFRKVFQRTVRRPTSDFVIPAKLVPAKAGSGNPRIFTQTLRPVTAPRNYDTIGRVLGNRGSLGTQRASLLAEAAEQKQSLTPRRLGVQLCRVLNKNDADA